MLFHLAPSHSTIEGEKNKNLSCYWEHHYIILYKHNKTPKNTQPNKTKQKIHTGNQTPTALRDALLLLAEDWGLAAPGNVCVRAEYGHAELYACIPQSDRAIELRSRAAGCTAMAILIEIIQWQKAFSSKALLHKLLFQNLWHVHCVHPSLPQPQPPTALFMEAESWMGTSQTQETTCVRQHRNKLNGVRAQPHWGCAELSQEKPEGKWRFWATEPRCLAVSSCFLRLLPKHRLRQHTVLDSLTTRRQKKINYTRVCLAATETNCCALWEPEPLFCQRSPFCPLQTGPVRPSSDTGARTAGGPAQPRLPHCWGAPRAPLLGPPTASAIHTWISALNWWN